MSEAQNGGNVMERLTYWNEEYGCWSYHCGSGEAANRLAAYVETGRTPEEVTALGKLFDYALEESKTLTEQLALLNRIRDLAKADKDGRVVMLPCKVGDTVYFAAWFGTVPHIIKRIIEPYFYTDDARGGGSTADFFLRDFGKTVFLTREEAEQALEAMKDGN